MSYPCVRTRIANDSDFPTSFVRAAFNFCLPPGVTKIDVVFLEPVQQAPGNHLASVGLTASSGTTFNDRLFMSRSARQIVSLPPAAHCVERGLSP